MDAAPSRPSRARRGVLCALGLGAVVGALGLYAVAFRTVESHREASPDGRHVAVYTYCAYQTYIPRSIGDGSSKPGFVTIQTRDGASCGRVAVPLLWDFRLRWDADAAWSVGGATWDLARCRLVSPMDR